MTDQLSKHFRRGEFACKCGCGFDDVSQELVQVLEETREYFGVPVIITSGCRCISHNKKIGGAENSQHLLGTAADIKVKGVSVAHVFEYFKHKYPMRYGIGYYPTWVHIDVRENPARWWK